VREPVDRDQDNDVRDLQLSSAHVRKLRLDSATAVIDDPPLLQLFTAETLAEAVDGTNGCTYSLSVAAVVDQDGDVDVMIGTLAMTPAEARRLADALTIAAFVASQRLD